MQRRLRRPLACLALAVGLGIPAAGPSPVRAAEFSIAGLYRLEPQYADNLDLDRSGHKDAGLAFLEHEFRLNLSLRTGAVEAAVGLEFADGFFGAQDIRDPANPFDDGTTLALSPDTERDIVDSFWIRWLAPYFTLRAGWFTTDLGSYRLFLGEDGAPSVQVGRAFGPLELEYTFQKVAERAGIATGSASGGAPVVEAPRSTLLGVGDVDAHYLRAGVRSEELGAVDIRRAALWGVYAADRRPEDRAHLWVAGGQVDLRLGPLAVYGEVDYLEGRYEGSIAALLDRGPGGANDEVLKAGARLRGHVAFAGAALELSDWLPGPPVAVGVEGARGSGDRNPMDGRVEDITALTIVHDNLDDDFELSRLFGAFILAGHREYFERVANLTVVKPFLLTRVGHLELGAAVYWLRTTRSVATVLDGVATGGRSRDLGWQYEASARYQIAAGVTASAIYAYLDPGPALRPGGDPAQLLYGNLTFTF